MQSDFVLAVDVGTSAVKAVLFDNTMNQKAISRRSYPLEIPRSGWNEQDPDLVLYSTIQAIADVLGQVDKTRLAGIVFSCQMASIIAVNSHGKPISKILTWSDNRSNVIAKSIQLNLLAERVYKSTGCPVEGIYPLSKIRWMIENNITQPDSLYLSVKDYLLYHITGQFLTDWSMASSTGLLDIRQHVWDPDALSLAGIQPENLPNLVSPRFVITLGESDFLKQTGIPCGTQLVIGAGDAPLSSLGVGAFHPETLVVNVGTSTAARKIVTEPVIDPQKRLWTYVLDETHWVTGGMSSSGGMMYEWFIRQFDQATRDDAMSFPSDLEELASNTPPGAEGLFFIPYLAGEQCPAWQPQTRGGFIGLDLLHTRGHLTRAVLEGITFSIYRIIETIQSVDSSTINEIRVTGGLAASLLWQQIAADIFGAPLSITESNEGSARGAAMLAWNVLGYHNSIQEMERYPLQQIHIHSRKENHDQYIEQYKKYLSIVDCINKARLY